MKWVLVVSAIGSTLAQAYRCNFQGDADCASPVVRLHMDIWSTGILAALRPENDDTASDIRCTNCNAATFWMTSLIRSSIA